MSILFIDGGAEYARRIYRDQRTPYWSTCLPLVLERHGLLDVDRQGPAALADPQLLETYDVVLVGLLPHSAWNETIAHRLLDGPTPVLVEGPLAPVVHQALGVTSTNTYLLPSGRIAVVQSALEAAARCYGASAGGLLEPPQLANVPREPALDWSSIPRVPLTVEQAGSWLTPSWKVEALRVEATDTEVLAECRLPGEPPIPTLVRRGHLWALGTGLFNVLGRAISDAPHIGPCRSTAGRTIGLETLLLATIDLMHRQVHRDRVRVRPWPRGIDWVLSVRHDFDRPLSEPETADVIAMHGRTRTAATWYFRSEPRAGAARSTHGAADLAAARLVDRTERHEVALHSELSWAGANEEQGIVEAAISKRVRGVSAHGAPNCFRYQGAASVLWAEDREMLYTEMLGASHLHPHRFPMLTAAGELEPLEVICLPRHMSIDTGTGPQDVRPELVLTTASAFAQAGGAFQVMNHPDIHLEELEDTLSKIPSAGRADWTAEEIADWWRRSHSADHLRTRRRGGKQYAMESTEGVEGLVLELLAPDGSRREVAVSVAAGASTTVDFDQPTASSDG